MSYLLKMKSWSWFPEVLSNFGRNWTRPLETSFRTSSSEDMTRPDPKARIVIYCLLLHAFIPVVVDNSVFAPFVSGKILYSRFLSSLALLLLLVSWVLSPSFRNRIITAFKIIGKNPLFLSLSAFMMMLLLSATVAQNSFIAFFGDLERGEGTLSLVYYYLFFVLTLLMFSAKDWILFFQLTFISGFALFCKEVTDIIAGMDRPYSYIGNAALLAPCYLFVITGALLVIDHTKKYKDWRRKFWLFLSSFMIGISIAGVLLTGTRSTTLGLLAGALAIPYAVFRATKFSSFARKNRRWAIISIMVVGLLILVFSSSTKINTLWEHIPGVDRIAQVSFENRSIYTRFFAFEACLKALNPVENELMKLFLGWGSDNLSYAYNRYYDPHLFFYELSWYDRSHNKLLDVLIMHGILGFVAYAYLWIVFLLYVFRLKKSSLTFVAFLFFGISYFVQNLFLFDQICTYIAFFGILSFLVNLQHESYQNEPGSTTQSTGISLSPPSTTHNTTAVLLCTCLALISLYAFYAWSIIPYHQMKNYISMMKSGKPRLISAGIDAVIAPITNARVIICYHFLKTLTHDYGRSPELEPLFTKGLTAMKEIAANEPDNPKPLLLLGDAYTKKASVSGESEFYRLGERYYRTALELSPLRQDMRYVLAVNLFYQQRLPEAVALMRDTVALDLRVPQSHYYYGLFLSASGQQYYREAFRELEIAFSIPDFVPSSREHALITYSSLMRFFRGNGDTRLYHQARYRLISIASSDSSPN